MKIPNKVKRSKALDAKALVASAALDVYDKVGELPQGDEISPSGAAFVIDYLLPVGIETGDGRKFSVGAIEARTLPLPLLWQFQTDSGHNQSVIVGRIDSLEITDRGVENVRGVFDTNPYAREAERLIRSGFLRGVSADLDKFSATEDEEPETELAAEDGKKKPKKIENKGLTIDKARLMGATLVALPAFQEASVRIDENLTTDILPEGEYVDGILEEYSMESLVASAAPIEPPHAWFQHEPTTQPGPISISTEGRVTGYLALWSSNHVGYRNAQKPPRSRSNYKYFRTGQVRTDDGTDVTVGQLTLTGGHASMTADANAAVKHYDDTQSAFADVVVGEDQHGIYVAGSLRPGVTPEQIRIARASAFSGDWRPLNGNLELVAACAVNVPGFPTTRAMVASGGHVTALVAAGALPAPNQEADQMKSDIDALKSALFSIQSEDRVAKARAAFEGVPSTQEVLSDRAAKAFSIFEEEISSRRAKEEAELAARVEDLQRSFYA